MNVAKLSYFILIPDFIFLTVGAFFLSLLVTFLSTPFFIKISSHFKINDLPNQRKRHNQNTALLGGATILLGILLSTFAFMDLPQILSLQWLFLSAFFFFAVGLVDDLIDLRPTYKLLFQISFVGVMMWVSDVEIQWLPLMVLWTIFITNSFNLTDGIDGLAALTAMLPIVFCAVYFGVQQMWAWALFSSIVLGSTLGFFTNNLPPTKIFLGDNGSLLLGYIVSALLLKFITSASMTIELSAIGTALLCITYPILDTCSVFLKRSLQGISIFTPDRQHIHYRLLHMTKSPKKSLFIIFIVEVICTMIAFLWWF